MHHLPTAKGNDTFGVLDCQPRGQCASVDDRGASSECKPLIYCSHNSHSLFILLCRSSSRVDHGILLQLLQRRREFERERQQLLQERAQLLLERQREQMLLERARLLREQQHLFQDNVDTQMIRIERNRQLPQVRAFETHMLAWQQQQQAELVEEDREEETDTVSSSMIKPHP